MPFSVYLILAIISSAAMAVILKLFRDQKGNRYGLLLGNYLTCVLLSFLSLQEPALILHGDGTAYLCGVLGGILFVAGLVGMQSSIRENGAILTAAFSKMGLIVPLIVSILFLADPVKILQIPGMLLVLAAIWIISTDRSTGSGAAAAAEAVPSKRNIFLLLFTLLACGGGDAMAKIFSYAGQASQDGLYFLVLFVTAAILTTILLLTELHKTGKKPLLKEFLAGILVGIPNYFSSFLLLKALEGLPAVIVYPAFSTGTLALITLVSMLCFHERPSRRKWIGLVLIAAALVVLSL